MSDKLDKAIAVAMDVSMRRARGDNVADEDVVGQHPELAPYLEKELEKLKLLGKARSQLEKAEPRPVDIRFTRMATDDEDEADDPPDFETGFAVPVGAATTESRKAIEKTRPFRPLSRPAMAMLRIYHDDQRSYTNHFLRADRTVIGRVSGDVVIEHDPLISSAHAEIRRVANANRWEWHLKDLASTNGTFISVDRARLKDGDELLMGSQRYRFCAIANEARLEHVLANEVTDSMELSAEGTLVGRDKSDQMSAFWDEFLDAKHALIQMDRDRNWQITNTKSLNGIWYRVSELKLFRSCFFQIGEQRFGFRS